MIIKKSKVLKSNIYIAFFLSFGGFYAIMIAFASITGSTDGTRVFTIPARLIVILLLISIFYLKAESKQVIFEKYLIFFLFFSLTYLVRIFYSMADGFSGHKSATEILLYFISFVFIPIVTLSSTKFSIIENKVIAKSLLTGCFLFSLFSLYFYRDYLGSTLRLAASSGDESIISPLFLSYASALGLGLSSVIVITKNTYFKNYTFLYCTMLICFFPFFLGASRGSVLAILATYLVVVTLMPGYKKKMTVVALLMFLAIASIISISFLGSDVFDRFLSIQEDVKDGNDTAIRLVTWIHAWDQFTSSPIFGDSLEGTYDNYYPHNIFLEVLITTGLVGFIPFLIFIYLVSIKALKIIRNYPKDGWIVVPFIQGIVQGFFSGALYSSAWLAIGLALILSYSYKGRYD